MRMRDSIPALSLLLALVASASAGEPASDAPASYESLFTEILQNLPGKDKAKVDSARVRAPAVRPETSGTPVSLPAPAVERRQEALEKLAPEVKERVEKAIRTLENRKDERHQEFKEIDR